MVMFSCNRCSKGLKKKEVEKHSYQCGGPSKINVTCIDCLKDFVGNEYDKHTSCVTEDVRYGGKEVVAKETGKKQNEWLGIVRHVLDGKNTLEPDVRKFLKSIVHYGNIPRNLTKFQNFAKSSVRCFDVQLVDKAFSVLKTEFQKKNAPQIDSKAENPTNGNISSSGSNEKVDEESEGKKKPMEGEEKNEEKSVDTENEKSTNGQNSKKMSKKERKLLKKKAKSAAEFMEVEQYQKEEEGSDLEEKSIKKSKKRKLEDSEADGDGNAHIKKKRDKKKKVESDEQISGDALQIDEDDGELCPKEGGEGGGEKPVVAENENPPDDHNVGKLSKKERKLLKKKAKFAAEMKEVEQYQKEENGDLDEEGSKKSKKRKIEECEAALTNSDVKARDGKKGGKKRKMELSEQEVNGDEAAEPVESPNKESDTDSPKRPKKKFDWFDNIVQVVKKSKDGEISVKRLSKKIIDEYIAQYGDSGIHEKLEAKMNKKLKNCPQVKILKDKVKLIDSE